MSFFGLFARAEPLKIGAPAPAIFAVDQDGAKIDFTAVYAKGPTLVYFYPKADTPGCTAQACSLRDAFADLKGEGLQILGVSRDNPEAQRKFKDKYQLPFTLVADADGKVAEAFDVPMTLGFARRQSFLIKDGKVVWTALSAKTGEHAAEVQEAIDKLTN